MPPFESPVTNHDPFLLYLQTFNNETFKSYYNTVFPIDRFNLDLTQNMDFRTVINKGENKLRYGESLKKVDDEYKLILDFDGYAENIESKRCMEVTDMLHILISDEYQNTIKEPVYDYMRTPKEGV